jgi:hypothetical protein
MNFYSGYAMGTKTIAVRHGQRSKEANHGMSHHGSSQNSKLRLGREFFLSAHVLLFLFFLLLL